MAWTALARLAPLFTGALLALAAYQTVIVVRQAPAFTESLRTEGITGQTRTQDISAMYFYSDYLFQTAVGFVNADAFSFATIERPDELATGATVKERAQLATHLLQRSVSLDPANGHKWFVYAQALASADRSGDALAALDRSWILSPTTLRLAYQRVWLYWALEQTLEEGVLPDELKLRYFERYLADRTISEDFYGSRDPLPPLKH